MGEDGKGGIREAGKGRRGELGKGRRGEGGKGRRREGEKGREYGKYVKRNTVMEIIKSHRELRVYQIAFLTAQKIYQLSKKFPSTERYSLTDQICRSSRSVAANIAEAFRNRRYPAAFVSKLSWSEGEAAETQVWLEFSLACEYISAATFNELFNEYERIIGMIINMIRFPNQWKSN